MGKLSAESSRKFIHICVSNWWILAMLLYNDQNGWFVIIVPVMFIILNTISYKMELVKAMERSDEKTMGTIYFPISLLVLAFLFFILMDAPQIGAIGILIMGYGDGFAAVFGKKYGKKKLIDNKSLVGTITMFAFSLLITLLIGFRYYSLVTALIAGVVVSLFATFVELYSKKGLDDLFVPILSSLLYYVILLIL